jgi:hypothetical protein
MLNNSVGETGEDWFLIRLTNDPVPVVKFAGGHKVEHYIYKPLFLEASVED